MLALAVDEGLARAVREACEKYVVGVLS